MKIYLDDDMRYRPTPDGFRRARNFDEFRSLIDEAHESEEFIEAISFDNDLGEGEMEGHEIMKWLGEHYPEYLVGETKVSVHTANPSAEREMRAYLKNARENREAFLEMKNSEHPWGEWKRK